VHLQVQQLVDRLREKNYTLVVKEDVIEKLAEVGYDKEFGARPLKRAITSYLSVPISQFILKHPDTRVLSVSLQDSIISIR